MFRLTNLGLFSLFFPLANVLTQSDDGLGDYSIAKPSMNVINNDNTIFVINLGFEVGYSATSFNITLLSNDCKTSPDNVVRLDGPISAVGVDPNKYSASVVVERGLFGESPSVTPTDFDAYGYSAGVLNFCFKAETYAGDISVTFLTQRIEMSYDLTMNAFNIADIGLDQDNFSPVEPNDEVVTNVGTLNGECTDTHYVVDYSDIVSDATPVIIPASQEDHEILDEAVMFKCGNNSYLALVTRSDQLSEKALDLTVYDVKCNDPSHTFTSRKLAGVESQMALPRRKLDRKLPITVTSFNLNSDTAEDCSFEIGVDVISEIDEKLIMARHLITAQYDLNESLELLSAQVQTKEYTSTYVDFNSEYRVSACRCDSVSFDCSDESTTLTQNDLLYICLGASDNEVSITNFNMSIKQFGEDVYSVVNIGNNGPVSSSLSAIFQGDDRVKVVSRLVSALFDSGESTEESNLNVEGNAFLEFTERRTKRQLNSMRVPVHRALQDLPAEDPLMNWPKGKPVGNAPFSLAIKLKSESAETVRNMSKFVSLTSFAGFLVVMSIAFLVFKHRFKYMEKDTEKDVEKDGALVPPSIQANVSTDDDERASDNSLTAESPEITGTMVESATADVPTDVLASDAVDLAANQEITEQETTEQKTNEREITELETAKGGSIDEKVSDELPNIV